MMRDAEILTVYRMAVLERIAIERQIVMLKPSESAKATDACTRKLDQKRAELAAIEDRYERIIERQQDWRTRLIMRRYYGLGDTDASIAEDLGLTQETVNRKRNEIIKKL